MAAEIEDHDVQTWFESYLRVCNRHVFGELEHFVAEDVRVNGREIGRANYLAGLRTLARGFPDYRWTVRQLVINEGWLAVQALGTGTHLGTFLGLAATGRTVRRQEYAWYRIENFMIVELRDTIDRLALLEQLQAPG